MGHTGQLPPIEWFRDPTLPTLTPLTVTDEGRVYGHVAGWNTPHTGFPNRTVTPPRSRADYSWFHVGALKVRDGDDAKDISVGHLSMGSGHADTSLDYRAAADFYDNSASIAASVCVGEDAHGIWFSGAVSPDMDELRLRKFRSCALSGDWRRIGSGLELVAVLSVVTPGFPIPRARVASGGPFALVAAGAVRLDTSTFGKLVAESWSGKLSPTQSQSLSLDVDSFADAVAERLVARQKRDAELAAKREALLAELDDNPQRMAELLAEFDDDSDDVTFVSDMLAAFAVTDDDLAEVEVFKRGNWVTKTGTGHLPKYISRIKKHLMAKGMTEGHAIAVAKNAADRMCKSGDVNFPGKQNVNPGSRAEACAAVTEWKAKLAQSKSK